MRDWIRDMFWKIDDWDWAGIALKFAGGACVQLFRTIFFQKKDNK
ncbi:hypothetical protein ACT3T8_05970 [Halomonas sp. AOP1-B1-8]